MPAIFHISLCGVTLGFVPLLCVCWFLARLLSKASTATPNTLSVVMSIVLCPLFRRRIPLEISFKSGMHCCSITQTRLTVATAFGCGQLFVFISSATQFLFLLDTKLSLHWKSVIHRSMAEKNIRMQRHITIVVKISNEIS